MQSSMHYSWEWIEQHNSSLMGPVSRRFGFMFDPVAIKQAPVVLPKPWLDFWKQLPNYFIAKSVRDLSMQILPPLDVDALYEACDGDVLAFMKTKSIVFCIAQACIDFDRVISENMPEPEPLPEHIQAAMNDFVRYCQCPDYCALADMSLTASTLVDDNADLLNCTFDDFKLICPVNNAPSPEEVASGDTESARIRGNAENRFHNTPTMMEFRVSDLVDIVVTTQHLMHQHTESTDELAQQALMRNILSQLERAKDAFIRLRIGFSLLSRRTVDPVVWHRDIVKYTSGYGGHLGLSGPQAPCIHLIDAFLGRTAFHTELGQTSKKAFLQMQHNHQTFIKIVAAGPQLAQFAAACTEGRDNHPLSLAFNDLIDTYTKGFLSVHKGRAMEFAKMGFGEAGPREFTAETEYEWPSTENVVDKLSRFFDEASDERDQLKVNKP